MSYDRHVVGILHKPEVITGHIPNELYSKCFGTSKALEEFPREVTGARIYTGQKNTFSRGKQEACRGTMDN